MPAIDDFPSAEKKAQPGIVRIESYAVLAKRSFLPALDLEMRFVGYDVLRVYDLNGLPAFIRSA